MHLVLSELARASAPSALMANKCIAWMDGQTNCLTGFFKQTNKLNKQKTDLTTKQTYYFLRDRQSHQRDINASMTNMTMNFMFWGFQHKLYKICLSVSTLTDNNDSPVVAEQYDVKRRLKYKNVI